MLSMYVRIYIYVCEILYSLDYLLALAHHHPDNNGIDNDNSNGIYIDHATHLGKNETKHKNKINSIALDNSTID